MTVPSLRLGRRYIYTYIQTHICVIWLCVCVCEDRYYTNSTHRVQQENLFNFSTIAVSCVCNSLVTQSLFFLDYVCCECTLGARSLFFFFASLLTVLRSYDFFYTYFFSVCLFLLLLLFLFGSYFDLIVVVVLAVYRC